ncbi:MAG: HisA/HisF-related TIM barrel protein [Candidatus Odinarchaeota archaeon]
MGTRSVTELKQPSFETVPVIDVLDGRVVRGVRGERNNYKPVLPVFCHSSDPITIARSYRDQFCLQSLYVADLDRILGKGDNLEVIKNLKDLFPDPGHVYCDPGISTSEELEMLHSFIDNLVIGTETLQSLQLFEEAISIFKSDKVSASLDIKGGKVLNNSRELQGLEPVQVASLIAGTSVQRMFIIKLDSVGTGEGTDLDFYSNLQVPGVKLIPGGGIKNLKDVVSLKAAGFAGCMVASSFYSGVITPQDIRSIDD